MSLQILVVSLGKSLYTASSNKSVLIGWKSKEGLRHGRKFSKVMFKLTQKPRLSADLV